MIWQETSDGTWVSGFFKIHREIQGFSTWFTAPHAYRRVGVSKTLKEAKDDAKSYWERCRANSGIPVPLGRPAGLSPELPFPPASKVRD